MSIRKIVEDAVTYSLSLAKLVREYGDLKELPLFGLLRDDDGTLVVKVLEYVCRELSKELSDVEVFVKYRSVRTDGPYRRLAIETHKRLQQLGIEHPRRSSLRVRGVRKASYALAILAESPYIIEGIRTTSPPTVRSRALKYIHALTYLGLPLWADSPAVHNLETPKLRRILRYLATIAIALGEPPEDIPTEELLATELPLKPLGHIIMQKRIERLRLR